MKSNAATEPLLAARKAFTDNRAERVQLNQLATDTTARKLTLEVTCDLGDEKALAEITRLQVMESLIPRRLLNREEVGVTVGAGLLESCHKFISQSLAPRIRAMVASAREKTSAALQPHFSNRDDLERAVNKSGLVCELESFLYYATLRDEHGDGLLAYTDRLLKTWADCDAKESRP